MTQRTNAHRFRARMKHHRIRKDNRKLPTKEMERLMHEMKAVQKLVEEYMAMEPKPGKIKVRLGRMTANPQVFSQMFREYLSSMNLPAVDLEVEAVPVKGKCGNCGYEGNITVMEHVHFVRCPKCNKVADILQGNELKIVEPAASTF